MYSAARYCGEFLSWKTSSPDVGTRKVFMNCPHCSVVPLIVGASVGLLVNGEVPVGTAGDPVGRAVPSLSSGGGAIGSKGAVVGSPGAEVGFPGAEVGSAGADVGSIGAISVAGADVGSASLPPVGKGARVIGLGVGAGSLFVPALP